MKLGNTKVHAELTEVEDGAETAGTFGSQEIMRIKFPIVLGQIESLHDPLLGEGQNFFPQNLSF